MTVCPCGTTTGHGESCSGTDPLQWCESCAMLHKARGRLPIQIRTMDEAEAAGRVRDWMQGVYDRTALPIVIREAMANPENLEKALHGPADWAWSITEQQFREPTEGGGVLTLWVRERPRAIGIIQRDSANFTIATMIELDPA